MDLNVASNEQDFVVLDDDSWIVLSRISDSQQPCLRKYNSNGDILWSYILNVYMGDTGNSTNTRAPLQKLHIHSDSTISILWNNFPNDPTYGYSYLTRFSLAELDNMESVVTPESHKFEKTLIKKIDITGREVSHTTNQILFHIYDDGSVEKKFIVE